jgi:hypothetical protein
MRASGMAMPDKCEGDLMRICRKRIDSASERLVRGAVEHQWQSAGVSRVRFERQFRWLRVIGLALLPFTGATAMAAPASIQTQITMIRTGWNRDQFAIVTVAKIQDPAKCGTADGYLTDSTQPGYLTYYAAALLAFAERATVIVVVDEQACLAGRPKLIGINIVR